MMAGSYILSLPMMFAHVWYPHLQEEYGRREDPKAIRNYLLKPVMTISVLVPFLCALAIFTMPLLVHYFLPRFEPGLAVMKIYLISSFFILLAQFSVSFLITLDIYWINIAVLLGSIGVNISMNLLFLHLGWGLRGVAVGTVLGFIFNGTAMYVIALQKFTKLRQIPKYLFQPVIVLVLLWAGLWAVDKYVDVGPFYWSCLIKLLVFMIWSVPFFFVLEKKTGLFKHLGKLLPKSKKEIEMDF
jgi:O-antigen/teichoic acid export membrane protein